MNVRCMLHAAEHSTVRRECLYLK